MQDAVPGTLTIFSHRMTVVRVLGSKFLLYHFGIKAVIILKYHGALIEPVYPIKEPASLSPWRFFRKFYIQSHSWNNVLIPCDV